MWWQRKYIQISLMWAWSYKIVVKWIIVLCLQWFCCKFTSLTSYLFMLQINNAAPGGARWFSEANRPVLTFLVSEDRRERFSASAGTPHCPESVSAAWTAAQCVCGFTDVGGNEDICVSVCVRARLNSCSPNYRSVCAPVTLNLKRAASGYK